MESELATADMVDVLHEMLIEDSDFEVEEIEDGDFNIVVQSPSSDSEHSDSDDDLFEFTNYLDEFQMEQRPNDHFEINSRNGLHMWKIRPGEYTGDRTQSSDIDCSNFGVQSIARNLKTPHEIFQLYFNDEVIDLIVRYTNIYISRICDRYTRHRDSKPVTKDEIYATIGLLIYSGIMKSSHPNISDLWMTDGTGIDLFRMTMCKSRFVFIMRCLRFDDFEKRRQNMKLDRLTQVRELMTLVQSNFQKAYVHGPSITLYEHVIPFSGKFPFRQYSSERPKKYGIKFTNMVDSDSFYFHSCEIQTKRSKVYRDSNHTTTTVVNLVQGIAGSHRDIITDEAHTSIQLSKTLKELGLNSIGALSVRDKSIPTSFVLTGRPTKSYLYGYKDDITLISYLPDRKRVDLFLTNRYQDRKVDAHHTKPDIVNRIYNARKEIEDFKLGVSTFGTGRKIKRWVLQVFFYMITMAQTNTHIILSKNVDGNAMNKVDFIKQLSLSLIKKQMENRSLSGFIPKELRKRIRYNVDIPVNTTPLSPKDGGPTKARCYVCPRIKDKKTRVKCYQCCQFICKEHTLSLCNTCFLESL